MEYKNKSTKARRSELEYSGGLLSCYLKLQYRLKKDLYRIGKVDIIREIRAKNYRSGKFQTASVRQVQAGLVKIRFFKKPSTVLGNLFSQNHKNMVLITKT